MNPEGNSVWRNFCSHKWEKQSEQILPAPIKALGGSYSFEKASSDFYQRTHIVILSCSECGEIYKSVEKG